jgi:hypothetical protein
MPVCPRQDRQGIGDQPDGRLRHVRQARQVEILVGQQDQVQVLVEAVHLAGLEGQAQGLGPGKQPLPEP